MAIEAPMKKDYLSVSLSSKEYFERTLKNGDKTSLSEIKVKERTQFALRRRKSSCNMVPRNGTE
jgi:hypothetical protein